MAAAAVTIGAQCALAALPPVAAPLPSSVPTDAAIAALDPALAARILALDPLHLSAADVRDVLSQAPAPRILAFSGSVAFVTMAPFSRFLIAMGYPAAQLANPRDGALSESSFAGSARIAGTLAWYYERDGSMPMLVGHSQGGMLVVRTLHELAGEFSPEVPVWNPLTDEAEPRATIVDPATGAPRPVVGLTVPYATAIATGRLPRLLLGQWSMLSRLRRIPDTVREFTGFSLPFDPIAGEFGGSEPYQATGTAEVRNVLLPAGYSHIDLPRAEHLAADPALRAWIEAYVPAATPPALPEAGGADASNLLHAADIWYSVRKHWCLEAQRRIRAQQGRAAQ